MFTLVVAPFFFLYCFLAVYFVRWVFRKTERRRSRALAIAFVVLLPTWDVVLSAAVLPIAVIVWPKKEIIEKIRTDGICCEGYGCDTLYVNYIN